MLRGAEPGRFLSSLTPRVVQRWPGKHFAKRYITQCSAAASERHPAPRRLEDIDNGRILGYGADLAEEHPGFGDEVYKKRRQMIQQLAKSHEIGQPIPRVEYTETERATWAFALHTLRDLYPAYACQTYNRSFPKFRFTEDYVPQLEDISAVIQEETGWQIRPTSGLMHPRDFLNGLAFKTFHSTQYVRHHTNPIYTPEPDLIHELLGHVTMLTDPMFCKMMHCIGLASLGASEERIWHLTKVYFYSVEYGVVYEGSDIKAFGAGILSSYGELQWMGDGKADVVPFDPYVPQPKMSYKDGFQQRYFALQSFEAGANLLEEYAATFS